MSWFDEQQQAVAQMAARQAQIAFTSSGSGWLTGGSAPNVQIPGGAINATGQPAVAGQGSFSAGGFMPATPTDPYAQTTFGITDPGQGVNKFLAGDQMGPNGLPLNGASPWPSAPAYGGATSQIPQGNPQQIYQQIMGGANDQASLLAHQAELEAAGFHLSPPNASGAISKIQTPDGQWVRVIGEGEGHPVWIPQGSAGTIGSLAGQPGMADGSLLTPWTEQFQPPSPGQIAQDPSYQFQMGQGLQGVQRSAAARGTLLTGGTLKALDQFGQGLASTFNDKYYNRAQQEYGLRKQNFQENQDRPYTKLSGLATLGKPQTLQPPTG